MIKDATLHDVPALVELERASFDTDRLDAVRLKYLIRSKTAKIYVYIRRSEIIGAIILLYRKNSSIVRLYSLAVLPAYQRAGIANEMCHYVEKVLENQNMKEIRLEVKEGNDAAIKFYKKIGYVDFGRYDAFYEDGKSALRMKKTFNTVAHYNA